MKLMLTTNNNRPNPKHRVRMSSTYFLCQLVDFMMVIST